MSNTNFYFVIVIPKKLTEYKLDLEVKDEKSEKKAIRIKTDDDEKYTYNLFYFKNLNKKCHLSLILKFQGDQFQTENELYINDGNDIFYFKHIKFSKYLSFFSFFKTKNPPNIKISESELFNFYFKCFKEKNIFNSFLSYSFKYFFKAINEVNEVIDLFEKFEDKYFINNPSIYNENSFGELMEIIVDKIIKKKNFNNLLFFLEKFPQSQNKFLKVIFSKEDYINFITKEFENILAILKYIKFNDKWLGIVINICFFKKMDKLFSIEGNSFKEILFKLIKCPLFIFNDLKNEINLRNIFKFIILFKFENIDTEYSLLIPSNQMEFYKILCKEKEINFVQFCSSILIEVNNYDDLNNWFQKSINKDKIKN